MADDGVQYEFKSVQAVRGIEARSIAKWQKAGWEFVDQDQGTLRTTLNFRRPKPKVPWVLIAVAAGVVLLLAIVGGIASALQGGNDKDPKSPSETTVAASEKPSETAKPDESASDESGADQVLTVENSKDLAALLAVRDYCDETIGTFVAKYEGRTIEFDGSIASMRNHGEYSTRYDILVSPGDKGPKSAAGPAFKFEDVNIPDLHLAGANIPNSVGAGDLLRVVARVGEYNPDQCLFILEPVSTKIR
ncbi:DUF4839 domain-containing protein [Micromonospora sp. AMSO12t]|uniref:DUF4839 domain-containing protein n=1 Tax=Micromonospora sp. AMSO12t TaxID=2650410 RepID=UPI00124B7D9B|nr:DUF4839 domain-containing protein [Micromonospora sp. AMSO12t]KAB1160062.1 DUF4839 domain-containing protein [Micromonospora sp. AMSO12t]